MFYTVADWNETQPVEARQPQHYFDTILGQFLRVSQRYTAPSRAV